MIYLSIPLALFLLFATIIYNFFNSWHQPSFIWLWLEINILAIIAIYLLLKLSPTNHRVIMWLRKNLTGYSLKKTHVRKKKSSLRVFIISSNYALLLLMPCSFAILGKWPKYILIPYLSLLIAFILYANLSILLLGHKKISLYRSSINLIASIFAFILALLIENICRIFIQEAFKISPEQLPTLNHIVFYFIFFILTIYSLLFVIPLVIDMLIKKKAYRKMQGYFYSFGATASISFMMILLSYFTTALNQILIWTYRADLPSYFYCEQTLYHQIPNESAAYAKINAHHYFVLYIEKGILYEKMIQCEGHHYQIVEFDEIVKTLDFP